MRALCGILFLLLSCTVCSSTSKCNRPEEIYGNARMEDDIGLLKEFGDGFEVQYSCQPGYSSSASLKRICVDGEWTSIKCTRCELMVNEGHRYANRNGEVIKNKTIPSEEIVTLICEPNYTLFKDGKADARIFATQRCKQGELTPDYKCKLKNNDKKKVDGEMVTTTNAAKDFLSKLTSENLLAVTTLKITTSDGCVLGTDLLNNMDVLGHSDGDEIYLFPDSRLDPGSELLFNCKKRHHEPVNRIFQCRKGQWNAADVDPSFSMILDNAKSYCRPVECNPCVFGDCIKDGICICHPGAIGKNCATPICHELCKKNRGKCVRPNICKCSTWRYGDNCEKVGCTLPPENNYLSFKKEGLPAIFEIGAKLSNDKITCLDAFLPSTNEDLICNGDNKWSEDVSCIAGARYEIYVTIGTGKWGGSWNTLNVSFINEGGQTTPSCFIHTVLYGGKTYRADIRTHYIGKIQRLHFTLTGKTFDSLQIQYISLNVSRGGQFEEYSIEGERWMHNDQASFDVDPGCPPPSLNGRLQAKQRYKVGDKIPTNDVQCEAGYIHSSPVTCLHNSNWSLTCKKEGNYTLTLSITPAANQKIKVVLHGTVGLTQELDLKQHGHLDRTPDSQSKILPSIGEIRNIEVNVVYGSRRFRNRYLQIVDQKSNKYYLSFYDGFIRGRTTVLVYDLYRPGCDGSTFLPEQNGFLRRSMLAELHVVFRTQDCRDVCRKNRGCTAVVVYMYLMIKDCYIVSDNSLDQFIFPSYESEHKIYFRACS